ncbi:MAG: hypothetical protein ABEJ65_09515 [bacterium]
MDIYRTILYTVGSLPFWTGERKLKRLLRGKPGSFWEDTPPLKPTYLCHHFFSALEDTQESVITRSLQKLKSSKYVVKERLSSSLPHQVIKFTDKGTRKYYNLLVKERDIADPAWWIRHVSRLNSPTRTGFLTGGEVVEFSGSLYLTQTPAFLEPEERVRDEGTAKLPESLNPPSGQNLILPASQYDPDSNTIHPETDGPEVRATSPDDLRRKLTHFRARERDPSEPDPYVLKGVLNEIAERNRPPFYCLTFENEQGQTVDLLADEQHLPDEIPLESGEQYAFGPVEEARDEENNSSVLQLKSNGQIQPHRQFQ